MRLILLVLIIEFFQRALHLDYTTSLDLLFLAGGVLLIAGAFYLIGRGRGKEPDRPGPDH